MKWSHMPKIAMMSDTSIMCQQHMGNYLGLDRATCNGDPSNRLVIKLGVFKTRGPPKIDPNRITMILMITPKKADFWNPPFWWGCSQDRLHGGLEVQRWVEGRRRLPKKKAACIVKIQITADDKGLGCG